MNKTSIFEMDLPKIDFLYISRDLFLRADSIESLERAIVENKHAIIIRSKTGIKYVAYTENESCQNGVFNAICSELMTDNQSFDNMGCDYKIIEK